MWLTPSHIQEAPLIKFLTLLVGIGSKFHFSVASFFQKMYEIFHRIYKAIIREDLLCLFFFFPKLAYSNLFPRGLYVCWCFPVCLGITASPFGIWLKIVLLPLSKQHSPHLNVSPSCPPLLHVFAWVCCPIHLLLKNARREWWCFLWVVCLFVCLPVTMHNAWALFGCWIKQVKI